MVGVIGEYNVSSWNPRQYAFQPVPFFGPNGTGPELVTPPVQALLNAGVRMGPPTTAEEVSRYFSQWHRFFGAVTEDFAKGRVTFESLQAALGYGPRGKVTSGRSPEAPQAPMNRIPGMHNPPGASTIDYNQNAYGLPSQVVSVNYLDNQGHTHPILLAPWHYSTTGGARWRPYPYATNEAIERRKIEEMNKLIARMKAETGNKNSSWPCTIL